MRRTVVALTLALLLPLAACGNDDDAGSAEGGSGSGELTVLAAASLTDVFGQLATAFEAEHDAYGLASRWALLGEVRREQT